MKTSFAAILVACLAGSALAAPVNDKRQVHLIEDPVKAIPDTIKELGTKNSTSGALAGVLSEKGALNTTVAGITGAISGKGGINSTVDALTKTAGDALEGLSNDGGPLDGVTRPLGKAVQGLAGGKHGADGDIGNTVQGLVTNGLGPQVQGVVVPLAGHAIPTPVTNLPGSVVGLANGASSGVPSTEALNKLFSDFVTNTLGGSGGPVDKLAAPGGPLDKLAGSNGPLQKLGGAAGFTGQLGKVVSSLPIA